jgi:hypothetical protein
MRGYGQRRGEADRDLSGPSGVELAASGEPAGAGYRVIEVGDSFAEVERVTT